MTPPRLLYIAFWFPPSRASGVYRALATVKAFVEQGWQVTVVTTTREFLEDEIGSVDDSLESDIPEGVEILRVPFTFQMDPLGLDVRRMPRFRGNFPQVWMAWYRATRRVRERLRIITGRSPASHPLADNYVTWIDATVSQILRRHAQEPFYRILATGNPFSSFEIARVVGELLDVPYSIDYRDPWTIDVFTGKPASLPLSTIEAEERIIRNSSAVIHVNEPIAAAYREKYPDLAHLQHVVLNGFDEDSIGELTTGSKGSLRFGMIGTVNDRWPLDPIFEGWIEHRSKLPAGSQLILAGHLGYFARSEGLLRQLLPDSETGFEYVGPVAKSEISSFYSGLDVVIVPVPGGDMVTSGKVFEAAALGIPVICVQAAGGGARKILADHPLAFLAEPSPDEVGAALVKAAAARARLTAEDSRRVRDQMATYERSRAIRAIVDIVNQAGNQ